MPRDIDIILERVRAAFPSAKIEQLKVSHPGVDDDGLWSFSREGEREEVSLESSSYDVPFVVEWTTSNRRLTVSTIDEAFQAVQEFLSSR